MSAAWLGVRGRPRSAPRGVLGCAERGVLLVCVALTLAPAAQGQEASDDEGPFSEAARDEASEPSEAELLQRARESFLAGRRAMAEEEWEEAATAFRDALDARPTPGLHYYLGVCLEQQGDPLAARRAYLEARSLLAQHSAADVAALLPAAFERVEAALGRLEVTVAPAEAAVRVDGSSWTPARAPWLAPGPHVLYAEAPGHEPVHLHFEVTAGALTELEVVLPPQVEAPVAPIVLAPAPPPAPPPPLEPPPPPTLPRAAFWSSVTFGVLGAAAGVAGVVWHLDATARVADAQERIDAGGPVDESACYGSVNDLPPACQDLRAALSHEETSLVLMIGGFAAAGVGALGAVASWAIWPSERFALRGRVGLGSAGVELRGRF